MGVFGSYLKTWSGVMLLFALFDGIVANVIKRASCPTPHFTTGVCSCENYIVTCYGLTTIPTFSGIKYTKVSFINGNFRSILNSSNPFRNLNTAELVLKNMHILRFSNTSFIPLKSTLRKLDLSGNYLVEMPWALKELNNLESLDISNNSIADDRDSMQAEIMRTIGATLTSLTFGGDDVLNWPSTLKHLQMLQKLNVTRAQLQFLPNDAFFGFDGTLLELSISDTALTSVPLAVANLRYLRKFDFDHNVRVGDYGMNVPIVRGRLPYLTNLSLMDDGLNTFPGALQAFEHLKSVSMDLNDLRFVSDTAAFSVRQIENLSMRNSKITRIPQALSDITSLKTLDLSDNEIHSVDIKDVRILKTVKKIKFNRNPILYVSDHAFDENANLEELELRNTSLTGVPCAIKSFLKNQARHKASFSFSIDLQYNKITCTCELKWLSDVVSNYTSTGRLTWNIYGLCDTINSSIDDYLKSQSLLDCPSADNIC